MTYIGGFLYEQIWISYFALITLSDRERLCVRRLSQQDNWIY